MNKSKILRFALTFLFLNNLSIANANYNCTLLPCGWYFSVEPFYAKATDTLITNSIVAVKIPDPAILGDFKEQYHLDLEKSWGGHVALGYDFPSCCNQNYGLSFEYTFFNHNNSAFIENDARNSAGLPVLAPAEFIDITDESSARFSTARADFQQRYATLDLLSAKNISICNDFLIKVFAGARYLHLREDLHNNYYFSGTIGTVNVQNRYDVNFQNETNDIGPRIGTRLIYNLVCGLGISGEVATSFLYGESSSEFHNIYHLAPTSPLGNPTDLTSANSHSDSAHVIPAISGKVSLIYQTRFCNCSSLAVELGYRGDKYFNALDDTAYQQLLAGDDINSSCNYQDFELSGPFLMVSFHM